METSQETPVATEEFAPAFKVEPRAPFVYAGTSLADRINKRLDIDEKLDRDQEEYFANLDDEPEIDEEEEVTGFLECPHCSAVMEEEEVFDGIYQICCPHCGTSGPRNKSLTRALAFAQIIFREDS